MARHPVGRSPGQSGAKTQGTVAGGVHLVAQGAEEEQEMRQWPDWALWLMFVLCLVASIGIALFT